MNNSLPDSPFVNDTDLIERHLWHGLEEEVVPAEQVAQVRDDPDGAGKVVLQDPLGDLGREAADRAVIQVRREAQRLVAAVGAYIRLLPHDIARVKRVDLELRGDLAFNSSQCRPDGAQKRWGRRR